MNWTDVKITVAAKDAEQAQAVATSIANSGIYIEDYSDLETQIGEMTQSAIIDETLIAKSREEVIVHVYLSPEENVAEMIALLQHGYQRAELIYKMQTEDVCQEDWETSWKAYYHALNIGTRLAVMPSWEQVVTDRVKILLDPGMTFGTGTHETTALCLETLDECVKGGERVLDIGTGSGILAIAALKLGAADAEGVDIDPLCVRTAGENAALNGIDSHFKVLIGDLSDQASGKYDIICANIVANAIKMLVPCVPPLLAQNGIFVASGIISERAEEVIAAIEATGLAVVQTNEKNGWVSFVCRHADIKKG